MKNESKVALVHNGVTLFHCFTNGQVSPTWFSLSPDYTDTQAMSDASDPFMIDAADLPTPAGTVLFFPVDDKGKKCSLQVNPAGVEATLRYAIEQNLISPDGIDFKAIYTRLQV